MLAGIRSRLTYANVISTLCLFLLLGGSAYAAFSLPKDSVKSKHIVDGQVKEQDLAADYLGATETAVNSEKVAGVDVCKGVARLPSSAGGVVEQQLCADGAVSIVADCRTHPGGQPTIAQVFAKTTEDNAIVGSTSLGGDLDFDVSESPQQLSYFSDANNDGLRAGSTTVEEASVGTESGDLVSLGWTSQVSSATGGNGAYCVFAYEGFG